MSKWPNSATRAAAAWALLAGAFATYAQAFQGASDAHLYLLSSTGYSDYGTQFVRVSGDNGLFAIDNRGNGDIRVQNEGSGIIEFMTGNTRRAIFQGNSPTLSSWAGSGEIGFQLGTGALFDFGGGANDTLASDGTNLTTPTAMSAAGFLCTGSTHCGSKALTGGTGTVTVVSGCKAICTNTTSVLAAQCSVSGTTLTVNSGAGTDTVNYFCF